ncbi:MAG: Npt1/Npt2 family nucleotide transporter [Alphaproteobacteria bacterium]
MQKFKDSKMNVKSTNLAGEFSGWRNILWPIHNYELKKFLPMGIMMLCILFNYTILRDTKDALVVLAPAGGAETISFLKLYGVTPAAIIFMLVFVKLANVFSRENLFYAVVTPFLLFFATFAFILFPNKEIFHMNVGTMTELQAAYPTFHWLIPVVGNWSFSLFYILSELWGSIVLSAMFWQFANHIVKVAEAKRFYSFFGMIGNFGLVLSGTVIMYSCHLAKQFGGSVTDAWEFNLKVQMSMVVVAGFIILGIYYWMHRSVLTDKRFYSPDEGDVKKKSKPKLSLVESVKYLFKSPYLGLIAVLVLAYGVSINLVEGVWKGQIAIQYPSENDYLAYMGGFSFITGFVSMAIMMIGQNILRRLSWCTAAIITPIMVLLTSLMFFGFIAYSNGVGNPWAPFMGTTFVWAAILIGQAQNTLSKSTKYSLFDSTKQMAYIPLDPELKVKGQAAVEIIGGRGGKSGGAAIQSTTLMIIGGGVYLYEIIHILAPIVIGVIILWCFSTVSLSKRFKALMQSKEA